jgi:hypothetical protein
MKKLMNGGISVKKIIVLTLIVLISLTSFTFAANLNATASHLNDQELDEWGILALYSHGFDVQYKTLGRVGDSNITTDYEAYILGAVPLGRNVSDYAQKIIAAQKKDGKFADYIDGSGTDLINAHVWGILSLYVANQETYDKGKALKWLKENQNEDGGFSVYTGDANSDLDMTAMAIVAYNILGLDANSEEITKALAFIQENLDRKESCESVAWYILARKQLGLEIDASLYNKLLAYQLQDGSFKHLKNLSRGNYIATWHGLLALSDYEAPVSIFTRLHNLNKFKDLRRNDYAFKEIMELVNRKVVSGYPDGTFKPDAPVKRSEFAKFLVYGMKLQHLITGETGAFTDLKGHWSNRIVNVAVQKKLMQGIGSGKFAPEEKITGAQVATILVRAKGLESQAKSITGTNWYDGYVAVARQNGLLYQNFDPTKYATRAQCAVVIAKLMK